MVFLPLSVCDKMFPPAAEIYSFEHAFQPQTPFIATLAKKRAALPASSATAAHGLGIAQLLHSPDVGPAASGTPSYALSFIVRRSSLTLLEPGI